MAVKHLTRRELKREDHIHATIAKASSVLFGRASLLLALLALVVAVIAGVWLWRNYQQSQDVKAQNEFAQALETFHGIVSGDAASTAPTGDGPVFASTQEKYQKALQQFTEIYQHYRSSKTGLLARYYAGLCQHQLKNDQEAIRLLEEVAGSAQGEARGLTRNALAEVYRASGRNEQALQVYQSMLEDSDTSFPKDAVLSNLAQLSELIGRSGEAATYYQRLTQEYAQSVYSNDARARLAVLNPPK
ncbi:MAG: tetratricopeptide repeat protein [Acidobacteria bacterium]|nr:tetratricopeptide repeat protein [Acidobacteriota bacterium]